MLIIIRDVRTGFCQTIFSGGNLVSLGVCIFAMYLYTPPQSRLPFC